MIVEWSARAINNLDAIWIYLSERNLAAAVQTVRAIRSAGDSLTDQPARGRRGQVGDTRELMVLGTPYIIVYRIQRERVEIAAVLHGAQRRPPR
jgi:plasmid stabilization system protein ParE